MSTITNTALNSRSLNGVITISDGNGTIIEEGNIQTGDINSDSLTTNNINTSLLTCSGEFRCNLNGPLTIPTSISSLTGLLISYGNVSNSGATDFTNFGSTYTTTQQGFRFFNKSNTQTLTNLAIIDNTQTYFSSQLTGCTCETPLNNNSVVNRSYVNDNFMYKTNNIAESISGWKTFLNRVNLNGGTALVVETGTSSFGGTSTFNAQTTFNNICPISNTDATLTNHLTTLGFNNGKYIDFTTDQTISATNKRFNGLFCTSLNITPTLGGAGNRQQIYVTGNQLTFNGLWNSNYYRFYCRDSLANETIPLEISSTSTIISNNLSGQRSSFRTPNVNESALALFGTGTVDNRIQFIPYADINLGYQNIFQNKDCGILFTSEQTIDRGAFCIAPWNSGSAGIRISVANVSIPGPLVMGGEASFNTWVNLKFRTRIYDISGGPNYAQMYMINGNEFVFAPNSNGDFISFYCKDATLGQLQTFKSSALGNTSLVNLTCSASLISNNLLATSSSIAGTNNLYTNLDPVNGFGIVNFGTRGNNINIKCNFNINESAYGTSQNTLIWMEGNSTRFQNDGSTNGNYIFTINESGTYNPLVINKTSVDIAGDAVVGGNLILYDTSPSTKNVIIGMVGNDLFFTPDFNVVSSSYYFKVADSISNISTPLIINSTNTTIANNLISNSQATFNNICPISNTTATLINHLTTLGFNDGKYIDFTSNQDVTGNKTFTNITSTRVLYTKDFRWYDAAGGSNIFQIYLSGVGLNFIPLFNSNVYLFKCRDAGSNTTTPLQIDSYSTTINNILTLNAGSRYYNTTNYTEFLQTGTQLTIKPVSNNGSLALYSTNSSGVQTQQLLIDNLGVNIYGIMTFYANPTTQFSTINQTSSTLNIENPTPNGTIKLKTRASVGAVQDSLILNVTSCDILSPTLNLTSTSTINIQSPNNLTGTLNLFSTLTSASLNIGSSTSSTTLSGDVTLSKTKNNSSYATYSGLSSGYIGNVLEVPPGVYLGTLTNTQYQIGAITLNSSNVGFWTCNYEVEINSITAGSISKIYVFISDNNISTTIPITLPGAKANNFSTQTYTAGDSTYHSGSFSFLQSTTTNIYAVQVKIIISSGTYQRNGQIRMIRII